jgi:hypothetical protein
MNMSVTIEQLRELRASLPKGQKDPWGECCINKRVLLQRALKRNTLAELTTGEQAVVQEFIGHCKSVRDEQKKLAAEIDQLSNTEI